MDSFKKPDTVVDPLTTLVVGLNSKDASYVVMEEAIPSVFDDNPFIIGGGQIYKMAMNVSDKIELTRVHEDFDADTFFPKISEDKWKLINEEFNEKDDLHKFSFTYKTYLKIKK